MGRQPMDAPHLTPFQIALDVRKKIVANIRGGFNYDAIIDDNTAGCITLLPYDVLSAPHFSSFAILRAGEGKHRVAAGTTMLVAQAAFDAWASDNDPRLQTQFDIETFKALYGLVQNSRVGNRTEVIQYMTTTPASLLLEALTLRSANSNWHSLVTTVLKDGEFDPDQYFPMIQNELAAIIARVQNTGLGKELFSHYDLTTLFNANS